ncbi:MAG: hypothetical protein GF313_12035 [Caldithrix sp.]|nr:hypothetical protein [Caldithrix sp.]
MSKEIKHAIYSEFTDRQFFTDRDFYDIPLLGEVKIDPLRHSSHYSIGEVIRNLHNDKEQSLTLQAMDNGLSGEGILEGDFLTIDVHKKVLDGYITAVQIGKKLYIRRLFYNKQLIRLEGSQMQDTPLIIDPKTPGFKILGKVVTVFRAL